MKILLRNLQAGSKETIELAAIPAAGDEIHWDERITKVTKVVWFPQPCDYAACLYTLDLS